MKFLAVRQLIIPLQGAALIVCRKREALGQDNYHTSKFTLSLILRNYIQGFYWGVFCFEDVNKTLAKLFRVIFRNVTLLDWGK